MIDLTRRLALAPVALCALTAALAVGACGSPADETTATSHSALTPNTQPVQTSYTFTLSNVKVVTATDHPGIPRTPSQPVWTPDTGFVDWAELATQVNGIGTQSTACILAGNAGTAGTNLNNCSSGSSTVNGPFTAGQPLHLTVATSSPNDKVQFGLLMDNLEATTAAQNNDNNANGVLANNLSAAGSIVGSIGAAVGVVNAWAGAVVASIAGTLSVVGNVLAANPSSPPNEVRLTCAGGLLGLNSNGTTNDSMYLTFTGQELAQLTETSTGSNTLTFNPQMSWNEFGAGTLGFTQCSSNLDITLTVSRDPTTGVGPSTKSADLAVARTPTENDAFWANAPMQSIDRIFNGGNGLQDIHIGSLLSVAGSPPVASVSLTANDLQTFWVDGSGNIQTANSAGNVWNMLLAGSSSPPAFGHLTAAERYPGNYDVAWIGNNGAVYSFDWTAGAVVQVTAANTAAAGGSIAMVGRAATDLDLFFIGNDGQVRTSYSSDGGQHWSTSVLPGGAIAPSWGAITAASPIAQAIDVFFIGNSGALYQCSWTPSYGWTTEAIPNTSALPGAPISVVTRAPTNLDVAYIGGYNVVWAQSYDASSAWPSGGKTDGVSWTITPLPKITPAGESVSIVAGSFTNLDVFFQNIVGQQYTGHWNEGTDTWTMSQLDVPPPPYVSTSANDRYWRDNAGSVYHQNGSGAVNYVLNAATAGYGASTSLAAFAYPDGGQSIWFLDGQQVPNLRQIYVSPSGGIAPSNWGAAPAGCTWWGKPAVSSWGENRADIYEDATCGSTTHLFHQAWQQQSFGWTDITPPNTDIASAPAVTSQQVGSLDVIFMTGDVILYGNCYGECTGADFIWYAPSGLMTQGGYTTWFGDVALASPTPGTLFAFGVDNWGHIDYSQWTTSTLSWTPSATWYAPSVPCDQEPGGPAVVRSAPNNLFVACTGTNGVVSGGWGDTSLQGTWWQLGTGAAPPSAPALTAH
jgi:hypothetical protein